MALDHARDFFHPCGMYSDCDPTDLTHTWPALFVTRRVTHFFAPVFVLLAGTGAFLSAARRKSRPELAKFLLVRGLWLILLELTVVRFAWCFNFDYRLLGVQVIWALGWSMVVLAGLVFLPAWAITAVGVTMIALHNLLDGVHAEDLGSLGWLWKVLHESDAILLAPGRVCFVACPLVPWIGVMAAGYGLGALLLLFGRVPLFFYLLHIPLLHGLAAAFANLRYGRAKWLFKNPFLPDDTRFPVPADYGYDLPVVYLVWLAVLLMLYPTCRWYADLKQRRRYAWLSYL